jgi:hypothetical protein
MVLNLKLTKVLNSFFLFQLNAPNMLNTHIYRHLHPTCFGVCYTIFKETIALFAQELYAFCFKKKLQNYKGALI